MTQFFTLASSSSGNSYYFGDSNHGILIDCGVSCRYLIRSLEDKNIPIDSLNAIIITHEHNDHIKGLLTLLKKHKIPVCASKEVISYLKNQILSPDLTDFNVISLEGSDINDFKVIPFETSHDSLKSFGYTIYYSGIKISVCTDTGILTDEMKGFMQGSKLILLESNYEKMILENGPYPYSLKKRIESQFGHLSNTDTSSVLPYFVGSGTDYIVLAHLSPINNIPELAKNTAVSELSIHGYVLDKDYHIFVAPKSEPSESILFKE